MFLVAIAVFAREARAEDRPYETVGKRFTALPLLNFSSDDGAGYGLRLSLFDYDGVSMPYRRAYGLQAFFTTKGKWVHRLSADMPHLRPGHRLEIELNYEKEDFANYTGELTDRELEAYTKAQKTFKQRYPTLMLMWIRDLRIPWRLRFGFRSGRNRITPNATTGSLLSLLDPPGASGGSLFQINTALRYDTRDDYINSTRGLLEEFLIEYSFGKGGSFNGGLISYEHRHFLSLRERWVFAQRANASLTLGSLPFYEEPILGGSKTIRGLPRARGRGEGRILFNSELRWRGVRVSKKQNLYLGLLLFGDIGQTFRRSDGPSLNDWRTGVGGGLRFYWYSTVVRVDYGVSENDTGLYMRFAQIF